MKETRESNGVSVFMNDISFRYTNSNTKVQSQSQAIDGIGRLYFLFAALRLRANFGKFWGDITITEDDSEIKPKVEGYKVIRQSYTHYPLH